MMHQVDVQGVSDWRWYHILQNVMSRFPINSAGQVSESSHDTSTVAVDGKDLPVQ